MYIYVHAERETEIKELLLHIVNVSCNTLQYVMDAARNMLQYVMDVKILLWFKKRLENA